MDPCYVNAHGKPFEVEMVQSLVRALDICNGVDWVDHAVAWTVGKAMGAVVENGYRNSLDLPPERDPLDNMTLFGIPVAVNDEMPVTEIYLTAMADGKLEKIGTIFNLEVPWTT